MREASFWQELRRGILQLYPGTHLVRIENRAAVGMPDVNGCTDGMEYWVELKCIATAPARGGIVRLEHYTQDQRHWIRKRGMAGGRVGLALKIEKPRQYFYFHWVAAQAVGSVTLQELIASASMHYEGKFRAEPFFASMVLRQNVHVLD